MIAHGNDQLDGDNQCSYSKVWFNPWPNTRRLRWTKKSYFKHSNIVCWWAGNMTTQPTKLLVLDPFRPFLLIPTLYDLKSFRGKWSRIMLNACKTAVYTILWLVTLIFIASDFCYCYLHRGDLVLIALPLSILLLGFQIICHFVSIRLKSDEIDEVIGRLQEIVERSNFQWILTLIG